MRVPASIMPASISLVLLVPLLLAATGHVTADEDVIPGAAFDHQNGWWAARVDVSEGFFAEVRVDNLWRDSQTRGATFVSVLDAAGEEVGSWTFVGEDGALTVSVEVAGVTVAPELPQIVESPFSQQIYFLLFFPVAGEHTLVFTGGAEGGFSGAVFLFLPPEDILAVSSGPEAHFVTEADLDCTAGVNAAVPTLEADGSLDAVVALAGCTYPLEAASGFAGLVRIDDQVNAATTEFGIRTPAGDRVAPDGEELLVASDTPGAWAIDVDWHIGRGGDGTWSGVTAVVADVAFP